MSSPVSIRRFYWPDLLFPALFTFSVVCLVGVYLTPQDVAPPLAAWIVLWSIPPLFLGASLYLAYKRLLYGKYFRYTSFGITVAWKDDQYRVYDNEFESTIVQFLDKISPKYLTTALPALQGCVVLFREPTWQVDARPGAVAHYVAGLQDGMLIHVGWNADLSHTALCHELMHRVYQICEGDPPQTIAHNMMKEFNI